MFHKKKLLLLISIGILLCILCVSVGAVDSGSLEYNLNWTLDDSGTLTISGTGSMKDCEFDVNTDMTEAPWANSLLKIKKVVIQEGVTSVGDYAFTKATNLESVILPNSLVSIGESAFNSCTSLQAITIPASVTELKACAFSNCSGLLTMTFLGNAPTLGESDDVLPSTATIYYDPTTSGWEDEAWAKFTKVATSLYTATMTASSTEIYAGEHFYVQIQSNRPFAAAEIELQFDTDILSFVENTEGLSSDSYTLHDAKIAVHDGKLKLANYGTEKTFYKLPFTAQKAGTATITLLSAKFGATEDALEKDLDTANIPTEGVTITVLHPRQSVTLPDFFDGESEVDYGNDYTFTVTGTNIYYNYEITASMGGEKVTCECENNTYTIRNVTGPLVISATQTPKTYEIRFLWNDDAETEAQSPQMIPYGTDYEFTFPTKANHSVSIDSIRYVHNTGSSVNGFASDNTFTIQGTAITDDIVVTFKSTQTNAIVTAYGDISELTYKTSATPGEAYTFSVNKDALYTYTVVVTVNNVEVKLTETDEGIYTIAAEDVQIGTIQITITKTLILTDFQVREYLQLDSTKMWRIFIKTEKMSGRNYMYKDTQLFWSDKYSGYCTLVIAQEMPTIQNGDMTLQASSEIAVDYGMDVNKTGHIDANDAQLVHNIYNAYFADFDEKATIEMFLRADINGDGTVNTTDAVAIVSHIVQP